MPSNFLTSLYKAIAAFGLEASVDVGVAGFCGSIGVAVSLSSFSGKAIYEYSSGDTVFDEPKQ